MSDMPAATANAALAVELVPATNYYLSLHSASPGTTGASEISGGSYARQVIQFASPSASATQSTGAQAFASMPAVTVTAFGIWSAVSGGTYIWGGNLTGSLTVPVGSSVDFATAAITASQS
jgi:hypothetical protein